MQTIKIILGIGLFLSSFMTFAELSQEGDTAGFVGSLIGLVIILSLAYWLVKSGLNKIEKESKTVKFIGGIIITVIGLYNIIIGILRSYFATDYSSDELSYQSDSAIFIISLGFIGVGIWLIIKAVKHRE